MTKKMIKLSLFIFLTVVFTALLCSCSNPTDEPDYRTYTITFDKNGGDIDAVPSSKTVKEPASALDTLPTPPAKSGYNFAGWNPQRNGSEEEFTTTSDVYSSFTVYAQWTRVFESLTFTTIADVHDYLAAAGKNTVGTPINLAVNMDLGVMANFESNWRKLLEALLEYKVFVELDLSLCTIEAGTVITFNPDYNVESGKPWITSLVLPNSVESLTDGSSAIRPFVYFTNLTKISGAGVKTLNLWCLTYMSNLTEADFPALETIGTYAFSNCTNLNKITLPSTLGTIGTYAFIRTGFTEIDLSTTDITTLSGSVFLDCEKLGSVTLPAGLTSMGSQAFQNCVSLTDITVPAGVPTINQNTFNGCTNLNRVTVLRWMPELSGTSRISTLSGTNAFTNTHADLEIKVPADAVDVYKVATNWSNAAIVNRISAIQ